MSDPDEHKTDFEAFVREAFADQRTAIANLASAIWDLLPRMTKAERTLAEHAQYLADLQSAARTKSTPPRGMGKVSDTGSHLIYDVQALIEQHDSTQDAQAYRALKTRSATIIGTVIASALGALLLFVAGAVYHKAYGGQPTSSTSTTIVAPAASGR
jgi:hypothetical protein